MIKLEEVLHATIKAFFRGRFSVAVQDAPIKAENCMEQSEFACKEGLVSMRVITVSNIDRRLNFRQTGTVKAIKLAHCFLEQCLSINLRLFF